MVDIKKLSAALIQRATTYNRFTEKAFKLIDKNVLQASRQFLSETYGDFAIDRLQWIDLMVDEFEDDTGKEIDILVIRGKMMFEPGETFIDGNGEKHENISAERALLLSSPFVLSIPLSLVESGSAEQVYYFIRQAENEYQEMREMIFGEDLPTTIGDALTMDMYDDSEEEPLDNIPKVLH